MTSFKKCRRKLTDAYGETHLRTVWKCLAKIGTTAGTVAYFFDEPRVGLVTHCVEESSNSIMYDRAISVKIDEISEEGRVFCYRY